MDKLSSLFTAIGEFLNNTRWFPQIQWTFCCLVIILAFCGVYSVRYGKKTLITLAFESVLKLVLIYIVASVFYIWVPPVLADYSQLPFLYVSDNAMTLVNPLGITQDWAVALPRMMVRLYMLLFFINISGIILTYRPENMLTWGFFQAMVCLGGIGLYALFYKLVNAIMRGYADLAYQILAGILVIGFGLLFFLKICYSFTFISSKNSPGFQKIYNTFTKNTFGKQFTVTTLAFLLFNAYLVLVALTGHSTLAYNTVSTFAFLLNSSMCVFVLYFLSRYFNG